MDLPAVPWLSLCSGVGGLDLGLALALPSARVVGYVEIETYACEVLVTRMEEGIVAPAPIWTDLATFDGTGWRGRVRGVLAGFPCQPWSAAGKGLGVADERWIWDDIERILRDVRPDLVFLENVPPLISRGGLALVLRSLADLGCNPALSSRT